MIDGDTCTIGYESRVEDVLHEYSQSTELNVSQNLEGIITDANHEFFLATVYDRIEKVNLELRYKISDLHNWQKPYIKRGRTIYLFISNKGHELEFKKSSLPSLDSLRESIEKYDISDHIEDC